MCIRDRHYDAVVNGLGAHFVWVNRGKESLTLDLKSEVGIDTLHRLLDRCDVLVSNLAPGSTARLSISPDDMAQRHPNVIAVEIDGYGKGGPISHKRAYDLDVYKRQAKYPPISAPRTRSGETPCSASSSVNANPCGSS